MSVASKKATVRYSTRDDKDAVVALAKGLRQVKDFAYVWERWGNWGPHPPIVIQDHDDRIIGFWAITMSARSKYVNSYFLGVEAGHQGRGLGGQLLAFMLTDAHAKGMKRLKFKAAKDDKGQAFWQGFGCQPFGDKGDERLWDLDIEGVVTVEAFIEWMKKTEQHAPMPDAERRRHQRNGVWFY
jgi:GNAT superfamily N-acetyltransferase